MKFSNQLAVVLLNTQREYLAGHTHKCLDAFFKTTASLDKKIDLLIYFNKGDISQYNDLLEYKNCANVNDVKIYSHQLSDFDDLYARTPKELEEMNLHKVPALGGSAGPNNLFFNTMIPLVGSEYRDLLMLEPDTQPIQDCWIDKVVEYCNSEKFLVAGSCYRGSGSFYPYFYWSGHINGVAIYRNTPILKVLLDHSKKLIEREIEYRNETLISFDLAIYQLSCTLSGRKHFNNRNLPHNQLIDCPIISNYSLPQDIDTTIERVKKEHPKTIILHKKIDTIKDPEHLPVFHHIAKNAGTYVLSWAQMLCRRYHLMRGDNQQQCWSENRIRRALVQLTGGKQLTVIYYTPTDLTGSPNGILDFFNCKKSDGSIDKNILANSQNSHINSILAQGGDSHTNIILPQKFLDFVQTKDVVPFCVIIDPMEPGWLEARKCIDLIIEKSERKHALHFTVLRDPYKRAQSLFHYLTSDESAHEPTHDSIQAKNFEDYIQSDELEDSWFLRNLMDLPDSVNINGHHFNLAEEKYLKDFIIADISKVDDLINDVFYKSYGISQLHVEDWILKNNINKNSTSKKTKIKIEDLDPAIQQKFLDRTYWDRKLWERYCK